MRYSHQKTTSVPVVYAHTTTSRVFFSEVGKGLSADAGQAALLLIGGSDERALYVRRAQAVLRYDRRSSYFSHAALIARWDPEHPERSIGLEVSLDPASSALQVPERNGVTTFALERYLDDARYPNLVLITLDLKAIEELDADGGKTIQSGQARKQALLDAALRPYQQRDIYPLWEGLAAWSKYSFSVERSPNPLLENVPLPAAAYLEYAFGAAGLDITPGASVQSTCPELLWATFLRWQESLAPDVERLQLHSLIRDEAGTSRPPLSLEIAL